MHASPTPGPWRVDGTNALGAYGVWTDYATHPGHDGAGYASQVCSVFQGNKSDFDRETRDANARLIAAAPDHAMLLRSIVRGVVRWEVWNDGVRGELCVGGLRYVTRLDEFGCPELTVHVRAALEK